MQEKSSKILYKYALGLSLIKLISSYTAYTTRTFNGDFKGEQFITIYD